MARLRETLARPAGRVLLRGDVAVPGAGEVLEGVADQLVAERLPEAISEAIRGFAP